VRRFTIKLFRRRLEPERVPHVLAGLAERVGIQVHQTFAGFTTEDTIQERATTRLAADRSGDDVSSGLGDTSLQAHVTGRMANHYVARIHAFIISSGAKVRRSMSGSASA
jgi:hypothetical protein